MFALLALFLSAHASEPIQFRENAATVRAEVPANGAHTLVIAGKDFRSLTITKARGPEIPYRITLNNEFLSSGHTTGVAIPLSSDGRGTYRVLLQNKGTNPARLELEVVKTGGAI